MLRLVLASALLMAVPATAQTGSAPLEGSAQQDAPDEISAAVAADWPRHDAEGKGYLTQEQFIGWLSALRAEGAQTAEDPTRVRLWAIESFTRADTDGNQQITPEEFAEFLKSKRSI